MSSNLRLAGILAAVYFASGCVMEVGTISDDPPGEGGEQEEEDPPPTTPVLHSILSGSFAPLGAYNGISGRAELVRSISGRTEVSFQITGVSPNQTYGAHVHNQPCAYQGGGHYMIDPAQTVAMETNELWLSLTTTAMGVGTAQADWQHMARGDALSIVVHDPLAENAKMACADLVAPEETQTAFPGSVAPFALAAGSDLAISGSASMMRTASSTSVDLTLDGLDPEALYGTHVHAQPCAVTEGGLHYKFDPTVVDALETNEVWVPVTNHTTGSMSSTIQVSHAVRADAQSIVVHRINPDDTKPKVACTDLVRTFPSLATAGSGVLLPDGSQRLPDLTASATMERSLANWTRVTLDASGLDPAIDYKAHVHNQPCSVENGGGHYMIDTTAAPDLETNEMWLTLSPDDAGTATDSMWVSHAARAEAQSIVIHDPADKARLVCVDLD